MTFEEAWAAHLKRQNIVPQDQQTFRHGWNAALVAAGDRVVCGETNRADILALEVEVYT